MPQGNQGSNPCPSARRALRRIRWQQRAGALVLSIALGLTPTGASAEEKKLSGADPLLEAARELRDGNTEAALAAVAEAEKSGASAGFILTVRGAIRLEQGRFDEAMADFRAAHEKSPELAGPRLHLGDTLLRQKKWEEARAIYSEMMQETNVLILNERLRYAVLITYLGAKDEAGARAALDRIVFPTESAAYYFAQAAWAFAHDQTSAGEKWVKNAGEIFKETQLAWFARPLYDLGWIKNKPIPVID